MPDPSTKQKVVVELERDEAKALGDPFADPFRLRKQFETGRHKLRAALSAQDVQEEKRCGGSGTISYPRLIALSGPEVGGPFPCPGCPDCSPGVQEGPGEGDVNWTADAVILTKGEAWELRAFALQAGADKLPNAHFINSALTKLASALGGVDSTQQHSPALTHQDRERLEEIADELAPPDPAPSPLLSEGVGEDREARVAVRLLSTLDSLTTAAVPIENGEGGEDDRERFSEEFQRACFLLAELKGEVQPDPTQQPAQEETVGQRIRRYRLSAGLTIHQLAKEAKVEPGAIELAEERADDEVPDYVVAQVAVALGLRTGTLLSATKEPVAPSEDQEGEDDWPEELFAVIALPPDGERPTLAWTPDQAEAIALASNRQIRRYIPAPGGEER